MFLKSIELSQLKENLWNPNFMTDKEFSHLVQQVRKGGMRQPILVRMHLEKGFFEIVDGCHRYRASKAAGLKEIDCVVVELTESEAKAATIAMNQIKGKMDDMTLAKLLENLKKDFGQGLSDEIGMEEKQLTALLKFLEMPEDLSKLSTTPESKDLTLTFIVTSEQSKLIHEALNVIDAKNKDFALYFLCQQFLQRKKVTEA